MTCGALPGHGCACVAQLAAERLVVDAGTAVGLPAALDAVVGAPLAQADRARSVFRADCAERILAHATGAASTDTEPIDRPATLRSPAPR